jgi:hypothetical protein
MVCARTGARLARSVVKTRDVLDGPYLDLLPDLMIEWNVDQPIDVATSALTGEIEREYTDARTGHHINDGFLLVSGAGAGQKWPTRTVDLADIAKAVIAHVRSSQGSFGAGIFV